MVNESKATNRARCARKRPHHPTVLAQRIASLYSRLLSGNKEVNIGHLSTAWSLVGTSRYSLAGAA